MLELNTSMPLLPGAAFGRKPFQVELDELDRTTGTPGSAFRIHAGDVIVFPDSTPYVVGIRINDKVDSPIAYYIAVKRNGENSWLDLGILTRTDADGKPLGKFQEQMLSFKTYRERLYFLRGRTIEGGELRTHEFQVLKDGQPTHERRIRQIPEIILHDIENTSVEDGNVPDNTIPPYGEGGRYYFVSGDIICFGTEVSSRVIGMGREPSLKCYIECSVNGYESRPVPLSVFHRFPVDNNWISSKTPFMSKLSCCSNDSELFELISGKTVKVLDVVPGYEIDFEAPRKSDGSYSLRKSMFPIFEQVLGK